MVASVGHEVLPDEFRQGTARCDASPGRCPTAPSRWPQRPLGKLFREDLIAQLQEDLMVERSGVAAADRIMIRAAARGP